MPHYPASPSDPIPYEDIRGMVQRIERTMTDRSRVLLYPTRSDRIRYAVEEIRLNRQYETEQWSK